MQYPRTLSIRLTPTLLRRRWLVFALLSMTLILSGCERTELERSDGILVNWDDYRGRWVLVNYWAEWCKPCLEEIPELNHLDKAPDITVLGVNFDGIEGQALEELGHRMGIEFTMLGRDPAPEFGWKMPMALPATFVVGPNGKLVETLFGPQTEDDIRTLIGNR